MLRLVSYDIENNKIRTRVAKMLLRAGLDRIQYSVFIGEISDEGWSHLWESMEGYTEDQLGEGDQICSFVIGPREFRKLLVLGKVPDIEYIMGEKDVLYL